ncbi:hypothetical protein NDU88_005161 [Pleurodeles waltl]|uniref:Uncharacterized protein n=1 Tax=Pleurodeles waltl TaxID=8319 RepID=A0AAV7MVX9_PLEWA|nr:hypothetical protein NDU88_005161 [Pleurodeles waltl]
MARGLLLRIGDLPPSWIYSYHCSHSPEMISQLMLSQSKPFWWALLSWADISDEEIAQASDRMATMKALGDK